MLDRDADTTMIYKIGTGWVFDAEHNKGYIVEREKTKRGYKGRVVDFIPAFKLKKDTGNEYKSDIMIAVPAGILRKAVEIAQLKEQGKLEVRKRGYK